MSIKKEKKTELIGKFKRKDSDTGSTEVQIAILTERINELLKHLKLNGKETYYVIYYRFSFNNIMGTWIRFILHPGGIYPHPTCCCNSYDFT